MKDVSQVLRQKEVEIERLRSEIEALHFVIPLLAEDADWIENEDQRVRELMTSRSAQQKLRRALEAETLQGRRLFKMLPDAFVFSYAGGEGNLVKLNFRPNPSFHSPSLEARVFHDMEGQMWVDCKQERLAAFDGHLTQILHQRKDIGFPHLQSKLESPALLTGRFLGSLPSLPERA